VNGGGAEAGEAERLRQGLADGLVGKGSIRSAAVEAAFRKVPRHLFTPEVGLARAYADDVVRTKRDADGATTSSASAPWLQAVMLEQTMTGPGMRCLEIGSGGYNAALLRELVGPTGSVTTMDLDGEVVSRARACLAAAGYGDVRVLHADGEFGAAQFGPFDRIVVAAGAWDVPPAWVGQLVEGGRLVVPLRTFGMTRSWALARQSNVLVGGDPRMCGFVPMRGVSGYRGATVEIDDGVRLWPDERHPPDLDGLRGVLGLPSAEAWSGVTVDGMEPFDHLDLWLARLPGFVPLLAEQEAVDRGVVRPSWRLGTPAVVQCGTLAYRARLRPVEGVPDQYEFGAVAHGPDAAGLAGRFVEQVRAWHERARPRPGLTVLPAGTPDDRLPAGLVLDKRHTRIVVSWPTES
jgi:protein-L-isoaspartate(D-aspartate) O-methyltransferase